MAEKLHEKASYHNAMFVFAGISAICAFIGLPAGIYCAVVAYSSGNAPKVSDRTAPAPKIGAAYEIALVCGALALAAILVFSVLWIVRNWRPKGSRPEDTEAFRSAVKEWANGHNTVEVLKAGVKVLDLFTPLQIEAFEIAKNLHELAADKPRPAFDPKDFGADEDGKFGHNQVENLSAFSSAESAALYQWRQEIRARYDLSGLKQRATKLYHRFVDEAHIVDHHLASLVDSVDTEDGLKDMTATIRKIAFQLENVK